MQVKDSTAPSTSQANRDATFTDCSATTLKTGGSDTTKKDSDEIVCRPNLAGELVKVTYVGADTVTLAEVVVVGKLWGRCSNKHVVGYVIYTILCTSRSSYCR